MDRFIVKAYQKYLRKFTTLKSNMDRFIDEGISILENSAKIFKIQYG